MTEEAMPDEDALDDVLAAALELDLLTEADLDVLTDKIAEGETTCSAALAESSSRRLVRSSTLAVTASEVASIVARLPSVGGIEEHPVGADHQRRGPAVRPAPVHILQPQKRFDSATPR